MQFFGVGVLEIVLVLIIAMIVVGPERLPQVAAELAKWIRRARSYANYVARDFNEVIGEIEKEVGANREDLREIASVFNRQAGLVARELEKASGELKEASDVEKLIEEPRNVVPIDSAASRQSVEKDSTALKEESAAEPEAAPAATDGATASEEPWYVPGRPRRRRTLE